MTGSIISEEYGITAAHCTAGLTDNENLSVRAGTADLSEGGVNVDVRSFSQHPRFSWDEIDFDITILRFASELTFSLQISPISLPSKDDIIEDGTLSLISGWGTTYSGAISTEIHLRAANVTISNQLACNVAYQGGITDRMICAGVPEGGVDSCQGSLLKNCLHFQPSNEFCLSF